MKTSMKRKSLVDKSERRAVRLGPGMHAATIELASGATYRVRTPEGVFTARLGEGVEPALAEACLRDARRVVLVDAPDGPEIVGALVTSLPLERDRDGRVDLSGRELRLRAERAITLEVGGTTISADDRGQVRLEGDRLVIDMGALVKILSTRVELP